MNLKTTDDSALVKKIETLVREERELLTSVLHHLLEINRRRLFSSLGYKSLFDFTVKHLGYPEDQAYRRISAMKLIQEIPEIEPVINAGEISLSHIGLAQTLFRQEKKMENEYSREQKLEVLSQIKNKSVREAQRVTLSMSSAPEPVKPDKVTSISETSVEIKFTASSELQSKVEKLKGLLAHKNPQLTLAELFDQLCDLGLQEWDPAKPKTATSQKSESKHLLSKAEIRRQVFKRAGGCCENCKSTFALEVDHVRPQALGGSSDLDNLRLLCRSCNQRSAIKVFGAQKMQGHLFKSS